MLTSYRNPPQKQLPFHGLFVDNFAGGGGASTGIERAIGRPVDIAINHDASAIAMHTVNHPQTTHYCESVWDVCPRTITNGQPISGVWLSPDCRHFSKAKGDTPVQKNIRGLAWVACRWGALKAKVLYLENVEEFQSWGPLIAKRDPGTGRVMKLDKSIAAPGERVPLDQQYLTPDPKRKGKHFKAFVAELRALGYQVEWKTLVASDYGAATSRKRFFLIARCDSKPITWPAATHGDPSRPNFKSLNLKRWKTAADIIDWSIPCRSIFNRKKPLSENTLKRIAKGIQRFVIDDPKPFIVRIGQQGFGADRMQYGTDKPLTTITTKQEHCLVTSHIIKLKNNQIGQTVLAPLPTLTNVAHVGEVRAFLIKYYGREEGGISLKQPLHTITAQDRFGLITVKGEQFQIVDICMRMLEPHELFRAQGFPKNYIISRDAFGRPIPKSKQTHRCGNSVSPDQAEALVAANHPFEEQLLEAA